MACMSHCTELSGSPVSAAALALAAFAAAPVALVASCSTWSSLATRSAGAWPMERGGGGGDPAGRPAPHGPVGAAAGALRAGVARVRLLGGAALEGEQPRVDRPAPPDLDRPGPRRVGVPPVGARQDPGQERKQRL